jgi:hypothetical protein
MTELCFTKDDLNQIRRIGTTPEKVLSQIDLFKKGTPYLKLVRPCTAGDGIRSISADEIKQLAAIYEKKSPGESLIKFVPASGAASRMFKTLLQFSNGNVKIEKDMITPAARQREGDSRDMLTFMDGIRRFAFFDDLNSVMAKDGLDIDGLINAGRFKEAIDYLLTSKGLGYASLPKGLIKFHHYPDAARTAFEEHLVEAAHYVKTGAGVCSLHFTVSPEHQQRFEDLLRDVRARYQKKYDAQFQVEFSLQKTSSNTIAVDLDNQPFRLEDGTLFFRPGGHGALIENLNSLSGDIIFIKNIDNVVPDRLKEHTFLWKKVLGGCLIQVRQKIFSYLERLIKGPASSELIQETFDFVSAELCIAPSDRQNLTDKQDFLINLLNRPTRVCGMVKNVGEPGGGPFWVDSQDRSRSIQIVENAQVDPDSEGQKRILASATHFNPVDIVCAIRDFRGAPFDLRRFVDPGAVFIAEKSNNGRAIKALELPGLWNGAMADWNTVFVEVPLITFNPVKTINDLLRGEHQP